MAITEIGTPAKAASTGTAISVTHGITIASGDIVVAQLNGNGAVTFADNNGAYPFVSGAPWPFTDGHYDSASVSVRYRVAGASEPAAYAWTMSASDRWFVTIRVFRGVNNTNVWDVVPAVANRNGSGTSVASCEAPSITTGYNNSLALLFCWGDVAGTLTYSGLTNGFGNLVQNIGYAQPQASATKTMGAAGAVGATSISVSPNSTFYVVQAALRSSDTALVGEFVGLTVTRMLNG